MTEKYVLANIKIPMIRRSTGKVESLLDYISIEFEKIDELPLKPDYKANYDFIKQKLGAMLSSPTAEEKKDSTEIIKLEEPVPVEQPIKLEEPVIEEKEPVPVEQPIKLEEPIKVEEPVIEEKETSTDIVMYEPEPEEINHPIFEAPKHLSEGSLFRYVVNVDNDMKEEETKIPFLNDDEPGPITFKSSLAEEIEEEYQPTMLEVAEKQVLQEQHALPKEQWSERMQNIKSHKRVKKQKPESKMSEPSYQEPPRINDSVEPLYQQELAPEIVTTEELSVSSATEGCKVEGFARISKADSEKDENPTGSLTESALPILEKVQKRRRSNRNSFKNRGAKSYRYTAKEFLE